MLNHSRQEVDQVAFPQRDRAEVIFDVRAQRGRNVYVPPRVLKVHTYPFRPLGARGRRGHAFSAEPHGLSPDWSLLKPSR